jgi:hypothetical protein
MVKSSDLTEKNNATAKKETIDKAEEFRKKPDSGYLIASAGKGY